MPKYREFLERYPTIEALAKAKTAQLRQTWSPLGYNVRPLRLRRIAQQVWRDYKGCIPDSYDGLVAMEGVGRYTAGAVLNFAFKKDAPIVDTNVARLLSRYFWKHRALTRTDAAAPSTHRQRHRRLWQLAEAVIPPGQGYLINQAMMDFGAMVCTAKTPRCPICVLRQGCSSFPLDRPRVSTPVHPIAPPT